MKQPINRREFITASTAVATGLVLRVGSSAPQTPAGPRGDAVAVAQAPTAPATPLTFKTKPHKALIARPTDDDLKRIKDVGFEGVEGRSSVTPDEAAKLRVVADKLGMRIHSVLIDKWSEFNNPDKSVVDRSFADSQAALRTAEAFGADTVLLVPGRIGDRKSTRLNSSHVAISYAVFCLKKKKDTPPSKLHASEKTRYKA